MCSHKADRNHGYHEPIMINKGGREESGNQDKGKTPDDSNAYAALAGT